jgi:hypothetical protein
MTPDWFHKRVNRLRGRCEDDTFRTVYAANTPAAIRRLARNADLEVEKLQLLEGRPEYCRLHPFLYLAGALYERLVNTSRAFCRFRLVLIAVFRKIDTPALSW